MSNTPPNSSDKPISDEDLQKIKAQLKEEITKEILQKVTQNQMNPPSNNSKKSSENLGMNQSSPVQTTNEKSDLEKIRNRQEDQKPLPVDREKTPEKIIVSMKTILKFTAHAFKYANSKIPREKWVEVLGILAGKFNEESNTLTIEDAYPMGHGNAIYTEIKDYKNFVRAFEDLRKAGLFICGWYHSHPSYGLFISAEDFSTQARYQRLWEKSVALVVDPYMIDGKNFGFEIFRANLKSKKWFSIPFSIKNAVSVQNLPEFLEFIHPIIEGKELFLEYDE